MKYTDWLIPELKNLQAKKEALNNIPERIKTLEMSFTAIKATCTDAVHVQGGTNQREEMLLSNIAEREKLKNNLEVTQREVDLMEEALKTLSNDERLVIERFYVHRERYFVDTLSEELQLEKSQIYRIKDSALINLARKLYGQVEL